jgi:hypothetical protein
MRLSSTLKSSAAAAAGALVLVVGAPGASAAPGAPNENSSCLAKIFQAQAVAAPQTVSNRIKEIREFFLGDTPFGQVLHPLAQVKDCAELE